MFRAADLVVLSKADLLGVLEDFDPARAAEALRALGRETPMIRTATRRAPSLEAWLAWLEHEVSARRALTARRASPGTATAAA
jgi:hydrogenase nickel incorporation protein HypB